MIEAQDGYRQNTYIHTISGPFYLDYPTWDINAIGHSLGMLCRFNGHCKRFYSVAEHSVLVADLMGLLDLGDPMEGLLHDATESVMSDIPSPFKHRLPDWQTIDFKLEKSLRKAYRLPDHKSPGCKHADWIALFIEASQLLDGEGKDFEDPLHIRDEAMKIQQEHGWYVDCLPPERATIAFYKRYESLVDEHFRSAAIATPDNEQW